MPARRLSVTSHEATDHQLLVAIYEFISELEPVMADLTQSVSDLQTAVTGLSTRVDSQVADLTAAISAAQTALTNFQAEDVGEDAAYEARIAELTAELESQLASAQSAADQIQTSVSDLNKIGAGEQPVDPNAGQ